MFYDSRMCAVQRLVAEVKQATESKTLFLSFICHELRNPLHAIIGMNELLKETELSDEQKECVESVSSASQLMSAIVNDGNNQHHLSFADFLGWGGLL
jgi:signal transduction histidine kinase